VIEAGHVLKQLCLVDLFHSSSQLKRTHYFGIKIIPVFYFCFWRNVEEELRFNLTLREYNSILNVSLISRLNNVVKIKKIIYLFKTKYMYFNSY